MKQYFGPDTTSKRTFFKSYGAVFLIIIAFFGGWYVGSGRGDGIQASGDSSFVQNKGIVGESYAATAPDFQIFWDVWEDIQAEFVDQPVNETDLFYGAMRGMLASVQDPYSEYYDPEMAAEFDAELSGSFSGIGVEVGVKNDLLVVIAPLEGSPGDRAGLRPSDKIIAIDGEETFFMSLDQAVSMIRGEEGTNVVLTIVSGQNDPREVTITRQKIEHTGLRWEYLDDGLVHVKFSSFDHDTENLLNKMVRELQERDNVKGLILDLRNNPGGFLDMAIESASEWVEQGIILRERDNTGEERQHHARGRARLKDYPTVVLVNEGSASASEIVAGAMQDYDLATVIGMTTFGKGSVQKYETLEDGSSFRLTVAKWFTPLERAIDEVGISPDIEIDLTEEDFNNDLDPQLEKAIELLR